MSNIGVKKEFHEFGKYIQVAAILTIVSITTGVAGFVAMIFIFIAMKSLNYKTIAIGDSYNDITMLTEADLTFFGTSNTTLFFLTRKPVF